MKSLSRRHMLKVTGALAAGAAVNQSAFSAPAASPSVNQWDVFEVSFPGPSNGNPFRDVHLNATFSNGKRTANVTGFYDGDGVYKVRFMPDSIGRWQFKTTSNAKELNGKTGTFMSAPASPDVRGPVIVRNGHHFGYADGTPYFPFGTTSYAWIHQSDELQKQTLETLAKAPFNKMRMCVFPKSYEYNHNEPGLYPFERDASGKSDFTRPNPAFYRHLEQRLSDLRDLNIQADLILFHPYDRWGYATMAANDDDAYLRYVLARLSSFRHIWWSMANEYDFLKTKTSADFDRLFQIVQNEDPSGHLRSIHYGHVPYDYSKPWVTHASLQTGDFTKTEEHLKTWKKPVVYDEVQYEGNLNRRWGNLSGEEMTYRFWRGVVAGAYVTHGETILDPNLPEFNEDDTPTLWWAHGGALRGTSPDRIGFLRKILESTAAGDRAKTVLAGMEAETSPYYPSADTYLNDGKSVSTVLCFMDYHQPIWSEFDLPEGKFTAELIDPWAMTITPVSGTFSGKSKLRLTGKPFQAVRFQRA